MRFDPKTELELALDRLLPEGVYDFQVVNAEDSVSSKGNEMIKLTIKVFSDGGHDIVIMDYLLSAMARKLRHFAYAVGLGDAYEHGMIDAVHCLGRSGKIELIVEEGKQKPEGGNYPAKNSVKDYIVVKENEGSSVVKQKGIEGLDDDVPF